MDTDAVGGQTTVLAGGADTETPGLLCHFRIGYLSGAGETVTEKLVQVYVTPSGEAESGDIDITGGLSSGAAADHPEVSRISANAEQLLDEAETVAWELIDDLAEEASEERQREIRIRREHTKKYFEYRINDKKEQIEKFEKKNKRSDEDMSVVLASNRKELSDLQQKKNAELARLEDEKEVVPDEPELINMAVVVDDSGI
jgi:hypothetical protein